MTTPGSRSAQQAYQQQAQNSSATFRRNTAYHDQRRMRRQGPIGLVRRLFGLLFSLVFVGIAIGLFLVILDAADLQWFDHVMAWFSRTF